ncbi:MAG: hypothetical protein HY644_06270 [Acidobacteria bacterium]|nr:hypothetical protein [Acidobacteriota bacterium]
MYPQLILRLIESCEHAVAGGVCRDEVRNHLLPEKVKHLLKSLLAQDFLDWARNDPDYRTYYEEMEKSGLCAQPTEAAAMILEAIVLDAIE